MIYRITNDGHKHAHLVRNREELMALRNSIENQDNLQKARKGDAKAKARLLQLSYNLGHVNGALAGCKSIGSYFFHDIDAYTPIQNSKLEIQNSQEGGDLRDLILSKKEEVGLMMLERSASGGWHLVCKRVPGTTILENQVRVATILKIEMDTSTKDLQRIVYSTSGSPEDLVYLDDELFTEPMTPEECVQEYNRLKARVMRKEENVPAGAKKANKHYRPWEDDDVKSKCKIQNSKLDEQSENNFQFSTFNSQLPTFKGIPYKDIIESWWKQTGGEPQEGERNVRLYQLAVNLRAITDNKKEVLLQIMPRLGLEEGEFRSIIDSACKEPPKGISKIMQSILAMYDVRSKMADVSLQPSNIDTQLELWGKQIEELFPKYPILQDICKGLKRNQYPAALFVAGGFMMTLMTRCTYRFYHRPEELRRLNNSTLIIGDPASGKSFASRLYKLLAAPIMEADKEGKDAINAYRELMRTKGANKDKPQKPKVIIRLHPARTSNAQFIQDMVNAVEEVDGEKMHLHMLTFDTELDNTVTVQKGGAWIDKLALELKAFHNEEDGQSYSNMDSVLQDFNVYWNYIYTGTPIALKKKVNEQNFGSGLATRLTCIPLPPTRFKMMSRESIVDHESDQRLRDWAGKLDRMKGELPLQRIVDELYEWTARRMADAEENESFAQEMLLKRCAYHGLNFSAPFIVMRHWDKMQQDGQYWCGTFETDDVDWQLAELITNIQYACQCHFFGSLAESYFENKDKAASVNVQRHKKTFEAFSLLPEEFTVDDVMRCFKLNNATAAHMRIGRLAKDHLIEKKNEVREGSVYKAIYCKTGAIML